MSVEAATAKRDEPKLLLVSQWFDPEPTFKGLVFAKALRERGYAVEVVTGFPNYPGGKLYPGHSIRPMRKCEIEGIRVTRLWLFPSHDNSKLGRVANYLSFCVSTFIYLTLFARKADVVYVYHPPLTVGLAAAASAIFRRWPIVLDIQDLWPDTLAATGMIAGKRALSWVASACDWLYRRASHIAVLSPGFKRRLVERGVADGKITVIPNWADADSIQASHAAPSRTAHRRFQILFAGNMGRAQKLDTVLDAARLLKENRPEIEYLMLGGGLDVARLAERAKAEKLDNVRFLPPVPMSEAGAYLAAADALLVHLRDDPLFAITIPSKTQAYLAAGRPIIMAVRGDAAALVERSKAGLVIDPENPAELALASMSLADRTPEERLAMGESGRRFYDEQLSLACGVMAFDEVFSRIISAAGARAS